MIKETKQVPSPLLETLRLSGIGKTLFQSPLNEGNQQVVEKLLSISEKLSPVALGETDHITRMWAYHQIGDPEKSLEAANRALNLNPDNSIALNCRVYLLAELNRIPEAITALNAYHLATLKFS